MFNGNVYIKVHSVCTDFPALVMDTSVWDPHHYRNFFNYYYYLFFFGQGICIFILYQKLYNICKHS